VIIANGRVNGYVANNTAWASGGIQLWQAGSGKSISGLVDFSFVFPAGRLSMNYMMIESIAMGRHDYDDNATLDMLSMGRTPTGSDASQCTIKMNANRNNAITNDMDTFTPQEVRVRGGVKVEF
jgi:hypothetical protein